MKTIRGIVLIGLLLITSLISSQVRVVLPQVGKALNEWVYIQGAGAGSYINILRSVEPNSIGNYQYNIYVNPFVTANMYMIFKGIKIYSWYGGNWVVTDNSTPYTMIVPGTKSLLIYTVFSSNPEQYYLVTIESMSIFNN